VWGVTNPAGAVTTEESASILVFPKVIADGQRNTIIEITNTSNMPQHAHCFYVNAAPRDPSRPISINPSNPNDPTANPPLWTEIDFDIWLTRQQPTHWVVSTGRLDFPGERDCRAVDCDATTSGTPDADCCDVGFDPGRVPPVAPDFTGELKCIVTMNDGVPLPVGNVLRGAATIEDVGSGDVTRYNAIGIRGFDDAVFDNVLCLGGDVSPECPLGAEYEACPSEWILDHPAAGAPDLAVDSQDSCEEPPCSTVTANLTLVPCSQDFEAQDPQPVTLQFEVFNEFEERLSASTTFQCWASYELSGAEPSVALPYGGISSVFDAGTIKGTTLKTKMRVVGGKGVIPVITETHTNTETKLTTRSTQNAHSGFTEGGPDLIIIPPEQAGQLQ
jgi:hypothetical protein